MRPLPRFKALPMLGLSLLVFVVATCAYVRTLLPGVGLWDTAEFQTVPALLGILHATGYPLYTLLGNLVSHLPGGTIAYRMNMFSAVSAAAGCGLLTGLLFRLGVGAGPALFAGLGLAFFEPLWTTALRADPHTLHAACLPLLLGLLLWWRSNPRPRSLAALGLGVGLMLSNHMQTTMLLPGLLVGVVWQRPWRLGWRETCAGLAGLVLGLTPYLYLPLRARQNPPLDYGHPVDWPHFRALVLGEHFHQDMGLFTFKGVETFLVQAGRLPGLYGDWLPNGYALLATGLGLLGIGVLLKRDAGLALALGAMLFLPLYWACTWVDGDATRYFIPPTVIGLMLAAMGAGQLLRRVALQAPQVALVLSLGLAVWPMSLLPANGPRVDRSTDHVGEQFVTAVFDRLPPHATIFTVWVDSTPLWYAHYIEGRRPDVRIVDDSEVVDGQAGDLLGAIATTANGHDAVFVLHPLDDAHRVQTAFPTRDMGPIAPFAYPLLEITGPRHTP